MNVTRGIQQRPPRVVLCGVEKIGKSSFAASSDAPVFIPVKGEEGIDALDVARFPVANSFEEVIGSLEELISEEHEYKTVVIDSLSTLEPLVWDALCKSEEAASIEKVGGGFGKGYIEALKYWRDIMAALDYLREHKGMGCILIAHVAVKTFSDPTGDTYDTYEMDINKKAVSAIARWCDAILFANCKTAVKVDKSGMKESKKGIMRNERVLFTQKRPSHPGGGRGAYGQVPYEMELDYAAWMAAVNAVNNKE